MAVVGQHVEQQGGAQDIGSGIVANPVHGLPGSRLRGQMNHRSNVTQGQNPIPALADIAPHDFYTVFLEQSAQLGLRIHPMDLRAQIVQQAHRHAALDQCPGKRQAR